MPPVASLEMIQFFVGLLRADWDHLFVVPAFSLRCSRCETVIEFDHTKMSHETFFLALLDHLRSHYIVEKQS